MVAAAVEPQPGLWWNPSESGRGYAIDPQGDTMVVTSFAYDSFGQMQWYISSGPMSNQGQHFSAPLLRFNNGQPLNGAWVFPSSDGSDGQLTIDFTTRTSAILTLPSGRQVNIQRQNFGVGNPPQALLGQWMFASSIGATNWLDRYAYTVVAAATSFGNGVVIDLPNNATAEFETSGSFAGRVVGFQFSSSSASASVLNEYSWTLQLEEGRGSWVSPLTGTSYGMNVYKTATASGVDKVGVESAVLEKGMTFQEPRAVSIEQMAAANPELAEIARAHWRSLQAAQR
jgi:hypothetical protein